MTVMGRLCVFGFLGLLTVRDVAADLTVASLGQWGRDHKAQRDVAAVMKSRAHTDKLGLIVSPGSNFEGGVTGDDDPRWKSLFEDVYADESAALRVPFMPVLGTGDWMGSYQSQITRSSHKSDNATYPKWSMPNYWYHYVRHFQASSSNSVLGLSSMDRSVGFIFIDTWILSGNFPSYQIAEKAYQDLVDTLAIAKKVLDYIIVIGDQPLYSSGRSGGSAYLRKRIGHLLEDANVDAYISGADNDLEIMEINGITHINCGNGARSTGRRAGAAGSLFYTGNAGYCLHRLTADSLHTDIVAATGETDERGSPVGSVVFSHDTPIKSRKERVLITNLAFFNAMPEVRHVDIPSVGRLPSKDVFVTLVGTIGVLIGTFFTALFVAQLSAKNMK